MNPILMEQMASAHRDDLLRTAALRRRGNLPRRREVASRSRERSLTFGRTVISIRRLATGGEEPLQQA